MASMDIKVIELMDPKTIGPVHMCFGTFRILA